MNSAGNSYRFRLSPALLVGLVLFPLTVADAIIIRHDKSYVSYQAREDQFPAVFYLERQGGRKVCVATLIDPQWALTAAHCATETGLAASLQRKQPFRVRLAGRARLIDGLVIHPDYVPGASTEVDMALLRFDQPVTFPVPIPLHVDGDENGRIVSLLGWGFFGIGTTGRQYDDGKFRHARNRITRAGRRLHLVFDDPRQSGSRSLALEGMPGLGDSGGPALLRNEAGWTLAGVAVGELMAAGFDEETQGSYGAVAVYERVSRHVPWIRRTITGNSGVPGS